LRPLALAAKRLQEAPVAPRKEHAMKLAARIAAALALVAFAAPALPCGDQAPKSASAEKKAAVAKADVKGKKAEKAQAQVKN
jgi:hypothetical protein